MHFQHCTLLGCRTTTYRNSTSQHCPTQCLYPVPTTKLCTTSQTYVTLWCCRLWPAQCIMQHGWLRYPDTLLGLAISASKWVRVAGGGAASGQEHLSQANHRVAFSTQPMEGGTPGWCAELESEMNVKWKTTKKHDCPRLGTNIFRMDAGEDQEICCISTSLENRNPSLVCKYSLIFK